MIDPHQAAILLAKSLLPQPMIERNRALTVHHVTKISHFLALPVYRVNDLLLRPRAFFIWADA